MKPNSANNTSEIKMIHHTEQFCNVYGCLHTFAFFNPHHLSQRYFEGSYISTGDRSTENKQRAYNLTSWKKCPTFIKRHKQ